MNTKTCKDLNCPRLTEQEGQTYCNQQGSDYGPRLVRQMFVSDTACLRLRKEMKEIKQGEQPWLE